MKPVVSVIVPFYNGAQYLEECLDSIRSQTLREIEIICVDDGSTDRAPGIVRQAAEVDDRVVLIQQGNRGAGAARNAGLEIAQGTYLSFLDADDFFEKEMLAEAVARAEQTGADLVCFGSGRYFDAERRWEGADWALRREQFPDLPAFPPLMIRPNIYRSMIGWAWDKLFRAEFVKNRGLAFQEISVHNDMYFTYTAMVLARKISIVDGVFAHHRVRESGSLSNADVKTDHMDCIRDSALMTLNKLVDLGLEETYGRDFINYTLSLLLYHFDSLHGRARQELFERMRQGWFDDFGYGTRTREYFYDAAEYARYLEIRGLPYDSVVEIENLRREHARTQSRLLAAERALRATEVDLATTRRQLKSRVAKVKRSRSYRVGHALLAVPRQIRSLARRLARGWG